MHWILNEIVGKIESPCHLGTCVDGGQGLEVPNMSLELTKSFPTDSLVKTGSHAACDYWWFGLCEMKCCCPTLELSCFFGLHGERMFYNYQFLKLDWSLAL